MIRSEIINCTIDSHPQRIQRVLLDQWKDLEFVFPRMTTAALAETAHVYQTQMVDVFPWYFGTLYLFRIPEELPLPFDPGRDQLITAKHWLEHHWNLPEGRRFLSELSGHHCLHIINGKNPLRHSFIPYTEQTGFLSEIPSQLAVNSSFFTFDLLDADSPYDVFGTPFGLMVRNGTVLQPPLYDREALLVDSDGHVQIRTMGIRDVSCGIQGMIYTRPQHRITPQSSQTDLVIINDRIVDVRCGGKTHIPSSGYVISTDETNHRPGDPVLYALPDSWCFGIQTGPAAVIDGAPVSSFLSSYCHPLRPFEIKYPPSRYPLNYVKDRAARIALGCDKESRPVLVWAEGLKQPGPDDSPGVSLKEFAEILCDLGLVQAVNLDGGGSAEILLDGKRYLRTAADSERPVPAGLIIR
ncbi:MAG: phosphodiester glycosidase family protein [Solobacterium sp.]|nr:phosphodiester glycosidase family protein [Solobacterium sp.]